MTKRKRKYRREDKYHSYSSWLFYHRWDRHNYHNYWTCLYHGKKLQDAFAPLYLLDEL